MPLCLLWDLSLQCTRKITELTGKCRCCADVPKDQRLQAIKAAIMLLPDENREVLQTLLYFLSDVTAAVKENQMTPTNLAVCLAPSLFHLNTLKRENSSPRYKSASLSF